MKAYEILEVRRGIKDDCVVRMASNPLPSYKMDGFTVELRDHGAVVLVINSCSLCTGTVEVPMSISKAAELFKWGHDLLS